MNEIITGNTATTTTEDPPTTTTGKSKKQITTFDSKIKNSNFESKFLIQLQNSFSS